MNKFQNEQCILYTNALFKEFDMYNLGVALYTTGFDDIEEDGKTYISLRKAYLELQDPTEYEFAVKYFQSWAHWKKVRSSSRVRVLADEWREELEVKLRSKGVQGIYNKMFEGDYQASKWLAEKGWEAKGLRKRGAPTKEDIILEARKSAKVVGIVDSHYERMNKKER